jgi:hypothetical protein
MITVKQTATIQVNNTKAVEVTSTQELEALRRTLLLMSIFILAAF